MKKLIFILGLVAALVLPAAAQFKGTNGTPFGYASSLGPGDVFIIGRPGSTNYNLASSNLLSFLGTVTSGAISLPVSLGADSFAAASSVGTVGTMFGPYWTSIGSKMTLNPQGGSTTNLELILDNTGGGKAHLRTGTYYGDGAGVSNAVTIIAGTNVNVLTNADGRTFTVSGSAGLTNSTSTSLGAGKISGASIGTNIAWGAVTGIPPLLTGFSTLSDPNADRLMFWDDSAGAYAFLSLGTGLTISGTTISASGGSGGSQTPWLSDIEGNNFGIVHSSGIGGRDDANGAALVLFSQDTDASITLYNYSTGFGIRYASTYGHTFTGPVAFNGNTTFYGSNYVDDLQFIALSSATQSNGVAYFNGAGELVVSNLVTQVPGNLFGDRAVWNGSAWEDDSRWSHFESEFLMSSAVGWPLATFGAGTGGQLSAVDTTTNRFGVQALSAGTTATSYYGECLGGASIRSFTWGQGEEMITDLTCYVPTLSDNTENYAFQFGYMDNQSTNAVQDGVFWQYSNNTNSGAWQIVSRNSTGSTNVYNIGTNVVANRWYGLRLKTAADGTSAAYLDGVLVQSGIAATSGQVIPIFRINKAAGTTDRTVRLDYWRWDVRRALSRYQ